MLEALDSPDKVLHVPYKSSAGGVSRLSTQHQRFLSILGRAHDYMTLVKPEVTSLVLVATALGSVMAARSMSPVALFHVLLGTALVAGGTATLNHYLEREPDAMMRRTSNRPLPAGRLTPLEVSLFGISLSATGVLYLGAFVNWLTSLLGLLTLLSYLLLYTPLKRRTSLCTLVGAFPGAAPVLLGWAAFRNSLSLEAWVLYAFLFTWQFPHFLAIAWMYREDYARARMMMLPFRDMAGRTTFFLVFAFSLALIPVSLLPSYLGMTGKIYSLMAFMLGLGLLFFAGQAFQQRSRMAARLLLHASVVYLPLVYAVMVMDRVQ
jgi:protoheme IX farnesyltransferase